MAEILNAGYTLQYLWEMRGRLAEQAHFDLDTARRTLSTFHLMRYQSPSLRPQRPLAEDDERLLAVYGNLLQRGLPTLPSLLVERALCASVRPVIAIDETISNGSFRFGHGNIVRQHEADWLAALVSAHQIVDPRLNPAMRSVEGFDSEAELIFYQTVLPQALGPAATLLTQPQRPIDTILPAAKAMQFQEQRLDFALETGGLRVVFEIDGAQHHRPAQHQLDQERDQALLDANWRVIRIPASQVNTPAAVDLVHNQVASLKDLERLNELYRRPLWQTDMGKAALQLVLAPMAVARIQRVLLVALEEGHLRLDQECWRLVIVERDVRAGALAVVDFLRHLEALYRLISLDRPIPKVMLRVYSTREFMGRAPELAPFVSDPGAIEVENYSLDDLPLDYFEGDLLLDVAVLQPPGFDRPKADVINRYLTIEGVAYEIRSQLYAQDQRRVSRCRPHPYALADAAPDVLRFFLQNVFRKHDFRDGQVGILKRSLALKPVIGLLPTGAGKSLCYQMSVLLQSGLSLVVVPLNSLMIDQVDNMRNKLAIDWLDYINSQRSATERRQIQERMAEGRLLLVLISPERLQSREFRGHLDEVAHTFPVTYAVIDEAHCVSEWGHDFRTSYLKLADTIRRYCTVDDHAPTTIALTGTASFAVLSDVQREIGVDDESAKVYPKSFDRKELSFGIVQAGSREKSLALKRLLDRLPQEFGRDRASFYTPTGSDDTTYAGIVFVPHTNADFGVSTVRNLIGKHLDTPVELFSGAQPKYWSGPSFDEYKLKTQRAFRDNKFTLLVATKAFGMGVDKPNVRFTIHYNISQSLEGFYQEAGRAGRDQKSSRCWVIFSDDKPEDADRAFAADVASEQIKEIAGGYDTGDVQRLLFLQQQSYPGIAREEAVIQNVMLTYLWPKLREQPPGVPVQVQVEFGGEEDARDKALYRLSLLGVVQDYTIDYHARVFDVTATRQTDADYVPYLQAYIRRYKTREISDLVPAEVQKLPGRTMLGKCLLYMLQFVYQEIERKRRVAIQSMAEVARRAAAQPERADGIIRSELLAYLEESPFTKPLEQIARRLDPQAWVDLLTVKDETGAALLSSVDGARQLMGGCRRMLESYPDDAGLLFLMSLARLLLPDPEVDLAVEESRRAFAGLRLLAQERQSHAIRLLLDTYTRRLRNTHDFRATYIAIVEGVLEEYPTRPLARQLYPEAPRKSKMILLNLTVADVRSLSEHLCT